MASSQDGLLDKTTCWVTWEMTRRTHTTIKGQSSECSLQAYDGRNLLYKLGSILQSAGLDAVVFQGLTPIR